MVHCYSPEQEAGLVLDLAKGDEDAMGALYEMHGGLVYRFALRMIQDQSLAEEVTQDVFLALLRQARQFDPAVGKLSTWLCGIARRLVWKHLERTRRLEPLDDVEEAPELDDPETLLARKEAIDAVHECIDALPVHLREVLVLCELEELSYESAAAVLNVAVGTIRSRLHRARRRLAEVLSGVGYEP